MASLVWTLAVLGPLLAPRALISRDEPGVAARDFARSVEVRLEGRPAVPPTPWAGWHAGLAGLRRLCPPGGLLN